jgi:hypothetical protein
MSRKYFFKVVYLYICALIFLFYISGKIFSNSKDQGYKWFILGETDRLPAFEPIGLGLFHLFRLFPNYENINFIVTVLLLYYLVQNLKKTHDVMILFFPILLASGSFQNLNVYIFQTKLMVVFQLMMQYYVPKNSLVYILTPLVHAQGVLSAPLLELKKNSILFGLLAFILSLIFFLFFVENVFLEFIFNLFIEKIYHLFHIRPSILQILVSLGLITILVALFVRTNFRPSFKSFAELPLGLFAIVISSNERIILSLYHWMLNGRRSLIWWLFWGAFALNEVLNFVRS